MGTLFSCRCRLLLKMEMQHLENKTKKKPIKRWVFYFLSLTWKEKRWVIAWSDSVAVGSYFLQSCCKLLSVSFWLCKYQKPGDLNDTAVLSWSSVGHKPDLGLPGLRSGCHIPSWGSKGKVCHLVSCPAPACCLGSLCHGSLPFQSQQWPWGLSKALLLFKGPTWLLSAFLDNPEEFLLFTWLATIIPLTPSCPITSFDLSSQGLGCGLPWKTFFCVIAW